MAKKAEKCVFLNSDLKPTEMLWHDPKRAVLTRQHRNIDKLLQICGEGWFKIR